MWLARHYAKSPAVPIMMVCSMICDAGYGIALRMDLLFSEA